MLEVRGELGFVSRKTCINVLQTNGRGINNSIDRLSQLGLLDGEEGLEIEGVKFEGGVGCGSGVAPGASDTSFAAGFCHFS